MKRLSRFFSVLLTVMTLMTLTALPSFAAPLDGVNSGYVAAGVLVIAVVLLLIIVFAARSKKKNSETQNNTNEDPATENQAEKTEAKETGIKETEEMSAADETVTSENAETENNDKEAGAVPQAEFSSVTEEKVAAVEAEVKAEKPVEEVKAAETEVKAEEPVEEVKVAETEVKAEEPAEEVKATETEVKAEKPAEEVKATETEVKAEEPAEEVKAAETEVKAEEPVEEVKVAEPEVKAEESTEEVKAAEKTSKPAEEKADTKKKATETVAEKPSEPAETKPEFAELVKEPTAARDVPKEAIDPETKTVYTFDEKGIPVPPEGMVIRYKWSFLARLAQADAEVKYHYLTLRRTLLAYKKMRSNVSWNYDSYFTGRKTIAKLKIRGKNLVVYFPIDPKTMEGTKYIGEDFSSVSRYKAVPFAYRINGTRKLKYATELIEQLMGGKPDADPQLVPEEDAEKALPFEDFDALYLKELIKIGGFLTLGSASASSDDDDE